MNDVIARVRKRLETDAARMRALATEREALASAYYRYVDNQEETARREKSAKALVALLGPERASDLVKTGEEAWEGIDWIQTAATLRKNAALWEHVEQYLRVVPEAQANEILGVLERLGISTNRQSLESAVRTHPRIFGVRKRNRERFFYRKEDGL